MKRNTFLHFITGTADPESTLAFQRVLSEEGNMDELKKKLDHFYRLNQEEGPVKKKIREFMGKGKDPFDLLPEELSRLTRVEKGETVTVREFLTPQMFDKPVTGEDLEEQIAAFYEKNRAFFESPNDLKFDPSSMKLDMKEVDPDTARKLLATIGVRGDKIEDLIKRVDQAETPDTMKIAIPIADLGYGDADEAKRELKAALVELGKTEGTAKVSAEKDGTEPKLLFTGGRDTFLLLMNRMGKSTTEVERLIRNLKQYLRK